MIEEYEDSRLDKNEQLQVCYDKKPPCVPNDNNISNNQKTLFSIDTTTDSLETAGNKQRVLNQEANSHKGENRHSKNIGDEESDNEKLILKLKSKIKDELEET